MKILALAALSCALVSGTVGAQTLGIHTVSHHWSEKDYNNVNPGVYVEYENFLLGTYRNSFKRQTYYLAYKLSADVYGWDVGIIAGLATGYKYRRVAVSDEKCVGQGLHFGCTVERGTTDSTVSPLAAFTVAAPAIYGFTPRISGMPPFLSKHSGMVHLSIEHPFSF